MNINRNRYVVKQNDEEYVLKQWEIEAAADGADSDISASLALDIIEGVHNDENGQWREESEEYLGDAYLGDMSFLNRLADSVGNADNLYWGYIRNTKYYFEVRFQKVNGVRSACYLYVSDIIEHKVVYSSTCTEDGDILASSNIKEINDFVTKLNNLD